MTERRFVTQLHVFVPQDFEETLELFFSMMKQNKVFMSTIRDQDRKRGIQSPAIRYIIQMFVDKNRQTFIASQQKRITQDGSATT